MTHVSDIRGPFDSAKIRANNIAEDIDLEGITETTLVALDWDKNKGVTRKSRSSAENSLSRRIRRTVNRLYSRDHLAVVADDWGRYRCDAERFHRHQTIIKYHVVGGGSMPWTGRRKCHRRKRAPSIIVRRSEKKNKNPVAEKIRVSRR